MGALARTRDGWPYCFLQSFNTIKTRGNLHVLTILKTSKRYKAIRLLWVWDTELATNLTREKIGDLSMSWNRRNAAGIGEIDVFAVLCPFVGENTSEPLQVSNGLPPLHLHLDLFDHYLVFG